MISFELPVVGYGLQSISSLIAIGTPSRTDICSPGVYHNKYGLNNVHEQGLDP